jgi:hypothetical protein
MPDAAPSTVAPEESPTEDDQRAVPPNHVSLAVTVLVPVLNRPHRAAPLVESLRGSRRQRPVRLMFICSPGDSDQIVTCMNLVERDRSGWSVNTVVADWQPGPGDYARKINFAALHVKTELMLLGADDLNFHAGWADEAATTQALTAACVVGTNDLGNAMVQAGLHSTHPVIHRGLLACGTADETGKILHEGYEHNFVDSELVATAKQRGTYAHCDRAIVEHLHHLWGKSPIDATYEKGAEGYQRDSALFNQRRRLWEQPWTAK